MIVKQLIKAFPDFQKAVPKSERDYLKVSELYYDTIQGEGINLGCPAAFLRLQDCILSCRWCDTKEVWKQGNPYTFTELIDIIVGSSLMNALIRGQHLVVTGGSPLMQQEALSRFFQVFDDTFGFIPYIEVENECVLIPNAKLVDYVLTWNNSPKLANSGVPPARRYKLEVIKLMSVLKNSWFKFVVDAPSDWEEIRKEFLNPHLIQRDQIILMPCGETREELEKNRELVVEMAVREGVRYCSREHIVLWNKRTGV